MKREKEKGMVLVMVVIFGAIVIMLGTALLSTSVVEVKSGNYYERDTQAYYVAKAGADIVAQKIIDGPITFTDGETKTYNGGLDSNNTYTVSATRSGNNIEVKSRGVSNGVDEDVNLNLLLKSDTDETITYTIDTAIFAYNYLKIDSPVKGDVKTNSTDPNSVELGWGTDNGALNGTIYIGKDGNKDKVVSYPDYFNKVPKIDNTGYNSPEYADPQMPLIPASLSTPLGYYISGAKYYIDASNTDELLLDTNTYFSELNIIQNSKLTINVGNNDVNVVVDKLIISGNSELLIKGTGTLNIYIKNSFDLSGSGKMNIDGTNNSKKLTMYYYNSSPITFSNGTQFCGIFQSDQAPITFTSGNLQSFIGTIISSTSSEIVVSGGFRTITNILYAPKATVRISATFDGSIISKKMYSSGGESINGPTSAIDITIPVSSGGGETGVTYEKINYE